VEIRQHITVILCLGMGLAAGLTVAQSSPGSGVEIGHAESAVPGLHDFDFLFGRWSIASSTVTSGSNSKGHYSASH
jgi:hypothetical protein